MLIVSGLVEIKPENAQAAIAAAREMAIASNEEDGCHSYAFYADLEVEGRFRVFEEWEDLAARAERLAGRCDCGALLSISGSLSHCRSCGREYRNS